MKNGKCESEEERKKEAESARRRDVIKSGSMREAEVKERPVFDKFPLSVPKKSPFQWKRMHLMFLVRPSVRWKEVSPSVFWRVGRGAKTYTLRTDLCLQRTSGGRPYEVCLRHGHVSARHIYAPW